MTEVKHTENDKTFEIFQNGKSAGIMTYTWAGDDKFIIDHTEATELGTEENVLHDRKLPHQRQLLMNNHNAFALGVADGLRLDAIAGKANFAVKFAVRVKPAQHGHLCDCQFVSMGRVLL